MKRTKKVLAVLATAALILAPSVKAQASYVTFTNFTFTTIAGSESYNQVTHRVKPDAEQTWYLTFTSTTGLLTNDASPFAVSAKNESQARSTYRWIPLTASLKSNQVYDSWMGIGKGTDCKLYVSGNNNAAHSHTITISGRYTS